MDKLVALAKSATPFVLLLCIGAIYYDGMIIDDLRADMSSLNKELTACRNDLRKMQK